MKASSILWLAVIFIFGMSGSPEALPLHLQAAEEGPTLSDQIQDLLYNYEGPLGYRNIQAAKGPTLKTLSVDPSYEDEIAYHMQRIPRVFPKPHSEKRESPSLPVMAAEPTWNRPKSDAKRTRLSVGLSLETLSSMLTKSNQDKDRARIAAIIRQRLLNAGR